ncbi:MAG TPA: hypothetical protein VHE54_14445 [Puia sp.]|nr:hypothetical protein [Puia sp.]
MPDSATIRVALVGDHSLNLHALAILLQEQRGFRVVSISKTASQLTNSIALSDADRHPDLVLLDSNFDLYGAVHMICCLRGLQPAIPLAVLGLTKDHAAILRLRVMGVQAYIPKNSDPAAFEAVLRRIARKENESAFSTGRFLGQLQPPIEDDAVAARDNAWPPIEDDAVAAHDSAWPPTSAAHRQYFRLAMSEISDEDIRRMMRLPQSEFGKLVTGMHRQFGVASTHGLVLALFRQRFVVMDDL